MGFSGDVAEKALLDCGRSCCICHRFRGMKTELHHIIQKSEGGADTYDNCIPLCFDCHAEVKAYNPKHPKGRQYTNSELKQHRDRWYNKVRNNQFITTTPEHMELDRKLFITIRKMLLSNNSILFLRKHDFAGSSFALEYLEDLKNFNNVCEFPEFEFIDADLETLRANLDHCIFSFLTEIGHNTFPEDSNDGKLRNRIPQEWKHKQWERFWDAADKINELAKEVVSSYNQLIQQGRRKLGVE
jgi:hypothetical protein